MRPFLAGLSILTLALGARSQTVLWRVKGQENPDFMGYDVASCGDVNGDGLTDLVVGAPAGESPGFSEAGLVHLLSGRDGAILWTRYGPKIGSFFGGTVDSIQDLDLDGIRDVLVGAPVIQKVYVLSGKSGATIRTIDSSDTYFGFELSSVGDLTGDGVEDILASSGGYGGIVYGFSGADGTVVFKLTSPSRSPGSFGFSLDDAGDVDGDGVEDFIVGEPTGGDRICSYALSYPGGRAYVISGKKRTVLHRFLRGNGCYYSYQTALPYFGYSVARAGDVDLDGCEDLLVGAPGVDPLGSPGIAETYVFSGKTGAILFKVADSRPDSDLGASLAAIGDLNHDGFPDFVAGTGNFYDGSESRGELHYYSGLDGRLMYIHEELGTQKYLGSSVAAIADLNVDRRTDIAVGDKVYNNDFHGAIAVIAGVDLLLHADDNDVTAGQTVVLTTSQSTQGLPAVLFFLSYQGVAVNVPVAFGTFDGNGQFIVSAATSPATPTGEYILQAFAIDPRATLVATNRESLRIH